MLIGQQVTVLGAGIGGLAAARALALRGAHVTVLEQAPEICEVGAGIQISPNGMAVLRALALWDAVRDVAVASQGVVLRDYARGRQVTRLDFKGRGAFALVHRADLIGVLLEGARQAGVQIRLGQRVTVVALDGERASADLDGGETIEMAKVVGADGLQSVVRQALAEQETAPFFTGQVAWRALVPGSPDADPVAQVFMGPGRHLVAYPLRGGALLNLVGVEEQDDWVREGWTHTDDPDNLRHAFASFGGPVPAWLAGVESCHLWGLFRHPVAERWFGPAAVLLGDAAHPTLPFLAQGACMALEDAWVLADALSGAEDWQTACAIYQQRRIDRTRRIIAAANANARKYHLRHPVVRGVAHAGLRMIGAAMPGFLADRFRWLYDHDVTQSR
ncbi:FAD-dependent monooxygenase [Actibacterium sp. 188UL27-1]|uniref:FAD-dependent monooxygenase n=1 Tax=Actibacterium sp. 188UL27-1 TaxID=2786961 RepID=UPI0019573162|nr:FAD-dependent monooxygenase [Actibacterium sp. 188UL27-1]MBM7069679.1 FAD-dependent monooxygenase [Actibacterium sp. 188UL27-1]